MAIDQGLKGVVKAGSPAVVVAEVRRYTLNTSTIVDNTTTPLGQTYRSARGTLQDISGTVECTSDPADAGQAELVSGTLVTLELYQQGEGSGLPLDTVTDTLIEQASTTVESETWVTTEFTFTGGGLVRSTQA